jgi:excisionase family DNA binding protein
MPPSPPLIDIPAAAEKLGTTVVHVRRLISNKTIPYIKIGALVRFRPDQLDQWITDNTQGGR